MKKIMKKAIAFLCCLVLAFIVVRFGPELYQRFFGSGSSRWISERFGEELKEKNELVVFETTLTGRETVSQDAWLLGKVQEVVIPYSFSVQFTVDLSKSTVTSEGNIVQVHLPRPAATYHNLSVDENNIQKMDWLYPLTAERYAAIVSQIDERLYQECAANETYLQAAWDTAEKNMSSLFQAVAAKAEYGVSCEIHVQPIDEQPAPTLPAV